MSSWPKEAQLNVHGLAPEILSGRKQEFYSSKGVSLECQWAF